MDIPYRTALISSCSAFFYGISFIGGNYFFWAIFAAYIALFFIFLTHASACVYGFLWGCIAYGMHVFPLYYALARHAPGHIVAGGLAVIVLYMAFYAGVWFWLVRRMSTLVGMIAVTSMYVWFMDSKFLWIFDYSEGYCCLHPLVPLARIKILGDLVGYVGLWCTTVLFIAGNGGLAWLLVHHYRKQALVYLMIMGIGGYVYTFFSPSKTDTPACIARVAWAHIPFVPGVQGAWKSIHAVGEAIREAVRSKPTASVIMMPESTCLFALNMYPDMLSYIQNCLLDKQLCLGAHERIGRNLYNTFYFLDNESVQVYRKQHGMFFGERMPTIMRWAMGDYCLLGTEFFCQARSVEVLQEITLYDQVSVQPCVCSDFFFGQHEKRGVDPLCVLLNDAWYEGTVMPDLLCNAAILKLRSVNRAGFYIAHTRAFYIEHDGYLWPLA